MVIDSNGTPNTPSARQTLKVTAEATAEATAKVSAKVITKLAAEVEEVYWLRRSRRAKRLKGNLVDRSMHGSDGRYISH